MLEMMDVAGEQLQAVRLEHHGATRLDTPIARGISLDREVQPGLRAAAHDVLWLADGQSESLVAPSLHCGLLLAGRSAPLFIENSPAIRYDKDRAVLVNFSQPARCTRAWSAGTRSRGAGFVVEPLFIERFGDTLKGDDLDLLVRKDREQFRSATLHASPQLSILALNVIENPYRGPLGDMFEEANIVRFLVEAVAAHGEGLRRARAMGRRAYERVCEARDLLDASLAAPPKTLDLARQVGLSLTVLQKNFKLAFGTTIFGYVRDRRLDIARIHILEHGRGVAETAYRVGYGSAAAFTAAYRRKFGTAPTKSFE